MTEDRRFSASDSFSTTGNSLTTSHAAKGSRKGLANGCSRTLTSEPAGIVRLQGVTEDMLAKQEPQVRHTGRNVERMTRGADAKKEPSKIRRALLLLPELGIKFPSPGTDTYDNFGRCK